MRLFLLTALTMTAFAANSVLNRAAVGRDYIDPVAFADIRLVSGALALMALVVLRKARGRGNLWPGWAGRATGSASLLLYLMGFSLAYRGLDAGAGALILFGVVQITMFAGALVRQEQVPAQRWFGAALAFAGLCWLFWPGAGVSISLTHGGLMAAAGFGWGIYSLAGRGARDPLGETAANFLLAVPPTLLFAVLVSPSPWQAPAVPAGVVLALVSGVVTSGLGYALWYAILPSLGATRAGVAQLSAPMIAAVGGLVLIGEPVTLKLVSAAALVLGGIAIALVPRRG